MPPAAAEGFERFWEAYPKRRAKLDALKAWTKLAPSSEVVTQMLHTITWQSRSAEWRKDGGQFVPYPGSWLRAGRWLDEPDEASARQQTMRPFTAQELSDATRVRSNWCGRCPHDPPCADGRECLGVIIRQWRRDRGEAS